MTAPASAAVPGVGVPHRAMWRAAATMAVLSFAAKGAGFVREVLVAHRFGTGPTVEAWLLAQMLPTLAVNVAVGVLPMALTPAYVAVRTHQGAEAAGHLAGTTLRTTYLWLALLAPLLVGATLWYGSTAHGLSDEVRALLPRFAWMLMPFTWLQGVSAAWSGVLAAEQAFTLVALAPALLPVGMVVGLTAGASLGLTALVGGLLLGATAQALVLGVALHQRGIPLWSRGASLHAVRRQYLPAVGGALCSSSNGVVDQIMAGTLAAGALATIGYAGRLTAMVMSLAIFALGTPLLPHLARLVERAAWTELLAFFDRTTRRLLLVTVPLAAALALYSTPLVRLAFERGMFSAADTAAVGITQAYYVWQLPGHVLSVVFARTLAAVRATRWLTTMAIVGVVLNVAANLGFMRMLGVPGIALATTIVHTVSAVVLGVVARRHLQRRLRGERASP